MKIPTTKPHFDDDDIQAISEGVQTILRTGQLILGPYTEELEKSFREYCGVKHAVAVASCTAALEIVLRYFDVRGQEVIVPTNSFISSSNAVIYAGGSPVLADIKADTLCLDLDEVLRRITPRTRGIVVVHVAGLPYPQMGELREICAEKHLFLVEDAAHAHGAAIDGQKTGSLGDAGCFSFYATKVMTTCTGGMVTTNNRELADYAASLRHYGKGKDLDGVVNLGNDWLMSEITALVGIYQLKSLDKNVTRRNEIAQAYTNGLAEVEGIEPFGTPPGATHSYYKYAAALSPTISREKLFEKMETESGVSVGTIYDPPIHLQPVYQRLFGFHRGMFPVAEAILKRTICLPMYVQMTSEEIAYVLESIKTTLPACRMSKDS